MTEAPGGQPARIHGPQPYDNREDRLPAPGLSSEEGVLAPSTQVNAWPATVPPTRTGAEGLAGSCLDSDPQTPRGTKWAFKPLSTWWSVTSTGD